MFTVTIFFCLLHISGNTGLVLYIDKIKSKFVTWTHQVSHTSDTAERRVGKRQKF
jgi:hypothetical protein